MVQDDERGQEDVQARVPWESPTLTEVGRLDEVVLAGSGKISMVAGNSGRPIPTPKGTRRQPPPRPRRK